MEGGWGSANVDVAPSSLRRAASSSSRTSRSRLCPASSRRRRLSAARHLSEHASRLRGSRGPPQTAQTDAGEATTVERRTEDAESVWQVGGLEGVLEALRPPDAIKDAISQERRSSSSSCDLELGAPAAAAVDLERGDERALYWGR